MGILFLVRGFVVLVPNSFSCLITWLFLIRTGFSNVASSTGGRAVEGETEEDGDTEAEAEADTLGLLLAE